MAVALLVFLPVAGASYSFVRDVFMPGAALNLTAARLTLHLDSPPSFSSHLLRR